MKFLIPLIFLFSVYSQAQQIVSAELKTPYTKAQCQTVGLDTMSTFGLFTQSFSYKNTAADEITISMINSLSICRLSTNGPKKLDWVSVNPFAGFEVQYFNDATQSIAMRKVWMDPAKPFNRLEIVLMNPESGKFWRSRMESRPNGSFSADLMVKKSGLLNAADQIEIKKGNTVRKTVELYHIFNSTTIVDGKEMLFGDESLSGRNIYLFFSL
jgi:hypothetical protein